MRRYEMQLQKTKMQCNLKEWCENTDANICI